MRKEIAFMRPQSIMILASLLGALAVIIGAFGAHLLQDFIVRNDRLDTFNTASTYHFYHSISLLFVGLAMKVTPAPILKYSALSFVLGIVVFSGSLYALSLTNITLLGAITPFGGLLFIVGWILLAIFAFRKM